METGELGSRGARVQGRWGPRRSAVETDYEIRITDYDSTEKTKISLQRRKERKGIKKNPSMSF
jgi:hypothetical protein